MTVKFESDKQFEKTLQEVKFLYLAAKSAQVDQSNYKTFNKCALLLLVVKLETYLENVVEDYINTINNLNVKTKSLPNIYSSLFPTLFQSITPVRGNLPSTPAPHLQSSNPFGLFG